MAHLQHYRSEKPYQRQKSAMQKQLESFLWSSPNKKTLSSASPNDIVSFLIWRDKFGKTKVHRNSCQSKNEPGGSILSCSCPKVLAAGTIDNNIGKLRALFKEHGRGGTWNDDLNVGNPAAHRSVKEYHSLVQEEQTIARCFPSQAVPLFLDKLKILCSHLRNLIVTPEMKSTTRYILARDLAFFSMDFFSGDRGTDLGRVKAMDVLTLHLESGILVNQVFGKTLRGNGARVFGLKPIQGAPYCPIMNLKYYKYLSEKMAVNLKEGYLFRVTDQHGHITDSPFIGSAVSNRLKKHLCDLKIHNGESMHSFRSGCSITLSSLGVSYAEVAAHMGWKSCEMAAYYCQFEKVMAHDGTSSRLSQAAGQSSVSNTSVAERLGQDFRDRNNLTGCEKFFD